MQVDYFLLYHGIENQPYTDYSSMCSTFFLLILRIMKFSVKDISTTVQARKSYLVCRLMSTCCKTERRTSLLWLIILHISPRFFLSILKIMKYFIIDISRTMQTRIVTLNTQVEESFPYQWIEHQPLPHYFSLYLSNSRLGTIIRIIHQLQHVVYVTLQSPFLYCYQRI